MTTLVVGGGGLVAAAAVAGAVGLGLAGVAALAGIGRKGRRRRKGGRRRYGRDVTTTGAGAEEDERAALMRLLEVIKEEDVTGCGRRLMCELAASDPTQLEEEHLAILDLLEPVVRPGEGLLPPGSAAEEYVRARGVGESGGDCALAYPACPVPPSQLPQLILDYLP
ncbi:hypothetical protein Pmani_004443 [Petrolisthes manimaculis]|uniref:Uncharacterized protein n=1 Tax=Petrolisthes manimaculis TaxID=1843537 RepID=A0AAE1QDP5_9EUCA|nr:hypothetical protein Pmani_004443 [Petrolisthes manimaculis]